VCHSGAIDEHDRYREIKGRHVHWREWGAASSPPLVFLHGAWLASAFYDTLVKELAATRHVFAPDQRGHGETDHEDDYSWSLWLDDIADFVDAVGLERFDLVGHSMGAGHGVLFAGCQPDRLRRLILLEGGFGPFTSPAQDTFWTTAFELNPDDGFESVDSYVDLVCRLFPRSERAAVRAGAAHYMQRPDGRWHWPFPADINHLNRADPSPSEEARLRMAIRCPVLVARAEFSELFVGDAHERAAAELNDGTAALIPGAGHNLQWENVRGSTALIRDFLSD
jgi:pimeloyl-ACP methyl ester carboxylesterase